MSLLTEASLVVTPNANKSGKLYSVIPSNGNGDFTVTRATTATRVNSAGLVEVVPYNLFTSSEDFTDVVWTKTTGTSVIANSTTAPNGTLTADTIVGATGPSVFGGSNTLVRGVGGLSFSTPYTFSVYLKGTGNVTITCRDGGTGFTNDVVCPLTSDWQRFQISRTTAVASTSLAFILSNPSGNFFIWGAQLVEGSTAKDYQKTETRLNIPRLDYSLGSCPNLLLEPQRTNLALRSEEFDNASWSKVGATITANSIVSPSGVQNADTITQSGATLNIFQTINIASSGNYTYSVYLKKGNFDSSSSFRFGVFRGSDLGYITFNFATNATSVISGTFVSHSATSVGNGWYLIQYTINIPTTGSANFYNGGVGASIGTNNFFYSWGAQLEAGAYATSYIPTTSASVTRNADVITRDNVFTNGLITASGGTWFVEFRNNIARTRDGAMTGLSLDTASGSFTNGFNIRNTGGNSRLNISSWQGGVGASLYTTTTDTTKIAIKWNGATADIFANGVKVVSATAFTPTAMQFLNATAISGIPYNINEMALFPTPLTDTQCTQLTTL